MEKTYFVEMVVSAVGKKYIFHMFTDANCSHCQVALFEVAQVPHL